MQKNDETAGLELQRLFIEADSESEVSVSTTLRGRQHIGWTSKGTSYCQMICEANKQRDCNGLLKTKTMMFEDLIYTDETSVQIETH